MANLNWTVDVENTKHVIRLYHAYFGGQRTIWVDDQIVTQSKKTYDSGSIHILQISDKVYELDIVTNGISFYYFLLQNGLPIPSDEQKEKGIKSQDLLHDRHLGDLSYWLDLGNALSLIYLPNRNAAWAWRNRLVGSMQGYIVVIQKSTFPRTNGAAWSILVHHARPLSSDAGEKIRSDSRVTALLGKLKKAKEAFEHTPGYTWIFFPTKKHETASALATRIRAFLSAVSMHTPLVREDLCENPECKRRFGTDNQLILVNGVPVLYCQDCIKEIPEQGKQAEKAYQSAPDNILPGLIVGIGIVVLGAMIWSAMAVLLDLVAAVISAVILVLIVRGMDQAGTKRSVRSLALAVLLTIISVTLGCIATLFFAFIRQGLPISLQTLFLAFNATFQDASMLVMAYLFTLLGGGSFLWSIWVQQKVQLSRSFKPIVETVPKESIVR